MYWLTKIQNRLKEQPWTNDTLEFIRPILEEMEEQNKWLCKQLECKQCKNKYYRTDANTSKHVEKHMHYSCTKCGAFNKAERVF